MLKTTTEKQLTEQSYTLRIGWFSPRTITARDYFEAQQIGRSLARLNGIDPDRAVVTPGKAEQR